MSWISNKIWSFNRNTPSKRTVFFLEKYKPKEEYLRGLAQNTSELETSEEKRSKLANWIRAPVSYALCFSFDQPGSAHTCDATKCIVRGCRIYHRRLICCSSATLEGRPIIYVIRTLAAQLFWFHAASGEQFTSKDFSDIKTDRGTMRNGVRFIRELLGLLAVQKLGCVVVIDNFHYLYGSQSDLAKDEVWADLFKALRCHKDCMPKESKALVKVFIRSSDSEDVLHNLGYAGEMVGAGHSSGHHPYGLLWHEIGML
ncbi:hypothetical protein OCU04_002598 [Sclerotinia nivalis]|uniref:Uncharacterized protein n=1 Tax=Sclerotinia nivalis TaxID=352851 RepID=A0A9X0ATX9_9HELO|nr:hypothetical protein OCU04_002598 [Sclerotinia nivalis]